MTAKIAEVQAASEQAAATLKDMETRLSDMAVLIKNITTYQKTKPAYDAYRKSKNKGSYRATHEREIILHEAAAKALKAAGVSKLPDVSALQAEYAKLQEQKEALYAEYGNKVFGGFFYIFMLQFLMKIKREWLGEIFRNIEQAYRR